MWDVREPRQQIIYPRPCCRVVRFFLNAFENWFKEAAPLTQHVSGGIPNLRGFVTELDHLLSDGSLHLRRDKLSPAYKNAQQLRWGRGHSHRKHGIRYLPRHNVKDAQSFLKPLVAPGL